MVEGHTTILSSSILIRLLSRFKYEVASKEVTEETAYALCDLFLFLTSGSKSVPFVNLQHPISLSLLPIAFLDC